MNLFEVATKEKFRFPYKGMVSVEDLWDLPLKGLDQVFKTLNAELKEVSSEESLLDVSEVDDELKIKIEIVRHIVKAKQEENAKRAAASEIKARKQKLLSILSEKEEASLYEKSKEELMKMIEELGE